MNDADGDGVCDEFEVAGCTDASACNYNADATDDDGSCDFADAGYDYVCLNDADGDGVCDEFEVAGCTDTLPVITMQMLPTMTAAVPNSTSAACAAVTVSQKARAIAKATDQKPATTATAFA